MVRASEAFGLKAVAESREEAMVEPESKIYPCKTAQNGVPQLRPVVPRFYAPHETSINVIK